jgi:hypothetical protein
VTFNCQEKKLFVSKFAGFAQKRRGEKEKRRKGKKLNLLFSLSPCLALRPYLALHKNNEREE